MQAFKFKAQSTSIPNTVFAIFLVKIIPFISRSNDFDVGIYSAKCPVKTAGKRK